MFFEKTNISVNKNNKMMDIAIFQNIYLTVVAWNNLGEAELKKK